MKSFKVWKSKAKESLVIPCRNRYGNFSHFEDHDGVIMIGFGDKAGFEPDKDALAFDKADLPKVIEFLKQAAERENYVQV